MFEAVLSMLDSAVTIACETRFEREINGEGLFVGLLDAESEPKDGWCCVEDVLVLVLVSSSAEKVRNDGWFR